MSAELKIAAAKETEVIADLYQSVRARTLEIVAPTGARGVPDVELLTIGGKTFMMDSHGFWGEDIYFYSRNGTPTTEPVQAIRIRSPLTLRISNLLWTGYDPAKVKR